MTILNTNILQTVILTSWLRFGVSDAPVQLSESCPPHAAPVPCDTLRSCLPSETMSQERRRGNSAEGWD